jgi:SAM-dependent methyltransferase
MSKDSKHWFASWFNTPFYHILYKNRDYKEARHFMENLTAYLNLAPDSTILDLACGKGRHSHYLNSIGYNVTGIDLSEDSIKLAMRFANETLKFEVHDMSKPFYKKFDAVFNLFTSFGYFENETDNLNTIKSIKSNLKENGIGVIDFMNTDLVIKNLVSRNDKTVDGIKFNLKRYVEYGYIVKDITFDIDHKSYNFQERVKAFSLEDFKEMFDKSGIVLLDVFGDYKLKKYRKEESERLIMIFM